MVKGALRSPRRREQGLDTQTIVALLQQHAEPRVDQALLGRMHHCNAPDIVPRSSDDPRLRRASLAPRLFNHVVDDLAMLVLRAKHDDLRVSINPHIVPRWPVEQVIGADCLLLAGRIGCGELTTQHEAPMGTLTEVFFQPLEERGGIHARGKGEVLAADLAISTRITKILALTDNGTWDRHLDIHLFLCNPHVFSP